MAIRKIIRCECDVHLMFLVIVLSCCCHTLFNAQPPADAALPLRACQCLSICADGSSPHVPFTLLRKRMEGARGVQEAAERGAGGAGGARAGGGSHARAVFNMQEGLSVGDCRGALVGGGHVLRARIMF